MVPPGKSTQIGCLVPKSTENIHKVGIILVGFRDMYLYTHTCMYAVIISEKRGYGFEVEREGIYRRI